MRPLSHAEIKNETTKDKQKPNKRKQNNLRVQATFIYLTSDSFF